MHIRIQIPAHNEAKTIKQVIEQSLIALSEFLTPEDQLSLLIIDDGSTDETLEFASQKSHQDPRVIVLSHDKKQGLGTTFKQGVLHALSSSVDLLVHMDADGQFNPKEIPQLLNKIINSHYDVVLGSRFMNANPSVSMPFIKVIGNHIISWILSRLISQTFNDVSCGFRVFSRRALMTLSLKGQFTYTHESILDCGYAGLAILEIPISIKNRSHGDRSRLFINPLHYGWHAGKIIFQTWYSHQLQHRFSKSL